MYGYCFKFGYGVNGGKGIAFDWTVIQFSDGNTITFSDGNEIGYTI